MLLEEEKNDDDYQEDDGEECEDEQHEKKRRREKEKDKELQLEKEEENSKLSSEVKDLQSKLQTKEQKKTKLKEQVIDLQFQLTLKEEERSQLESNYIQLQSNLDDREEEFIIELESKLEQFQYKYIEKEKEASRLQSEMTELKQEQVQQQEQAHSKSFESNDFDTTITMTTNSNKRNQNKEEETLIQLRVEITELKSKVQELTAALKSRDEETMTLRESLLKAVLEAKEHMNKLKELEKEQSTLKNKLQFQTDKEQNSSHIIGGHDEEVATTIKNHYTDYDTIITEQKQEEQEHEEELLANILSELNTAQIALAAERQAHSLEVNEHKVVRENLLKLEAELRSYKVTTGSGEKMKSLTESRDLKIMNESLSTEKNDLETLLQTDPQRQQQQSSGGSYFARNSAEKGRHGIRWLKRKYRKVVEHNEELSYLKDSYDRTSTMLSTISALSGGASSKSNIFNKGRMSKTWN